MRHVSPILTAVATACALGWPIGPASALELRQTKWPGCRALTDGGFDRTAIYQGRRVFTGRGCPESWDNGQGGTEYSFVFDRIQIHGPTSVTAKKGGLTCTGTNSAGFSWDCQ